MPRQDLIQLRGGTAAEWAATNPVLDDREPGVEDDTGQQKIGDGVSPWLDLPYVGLGLTGGGGGGGTVTQVNGHTPDGAGHITLDATDVSADPAGTADDAVTAHVAASDPHPQYQTAAEGGVTAATAAATAVAGHVGASDPHPQYLTAAEGDARYDDTGDAAAAQTAAEATAATALAGHVAASDPHPQYLTATEGNAAYDANGAAAGAVSAHAAAANPHPVYLTQPEGDALYQPLGEGAPTGGELLNVVTATGSTETLPGPETATVDDLTLTADCLITLTTPTDPSLAASILVMLRQPASGGSYGFTAIWADAIHWLDGGTPPIVATGQDAVTAVTLLWEQDHGWTGSASVADPGNQGVTLTVDGSGHVAVPAGSGDVFALVLTQNVVIDAPVGLTAWKKLLFCFMQDSAGGHTVTWNSIYGWSTTVPLVVLSPAPNATDYVGGIYNPVKTKVHMIGSDVGH